MNPMTLRDAGASLLEVDISLQACLHITCVTPRSALHIRGAYAPWVRVE